MLVGFGGKIINKIDMVIIFMVFIVREVGCVGGVYIIIY